MRKLYTMFSFTLRPKSLDDLNVINMVLQSPGGLKDPINPIKSNINEFLLTA